jgi:hypothetical protein
MHPSLSGRSLLERACQTNAEISRLEPECDEGDRRLGPHGQHVGQ